MHIEYHKEYSHHLGRDMEFKVYGHAGKPAFVVPCQDGRFYDWEGFGMLETLEDYLESGRLQLFTVDTIDKETVSAVDGNPYDRVRRHETWYKSWSPASTRSTVRGRGFCPRAFPWAHTTRRTSFSAARTFSTA